jgi:mRNA-degrading endonuclease RelE of RelBE toxin-antitoxin system
VQQSPDTVVLRTNKKEGSRKKAFLTKSWLLPSLQDQSIPNGDPIQSSFLSLSVSSWTFDGAFHEDVETIAIECPKNPDEIIKIPSLGVYPLRFADSAIAIALRKQGEMFWKLRRGGYVYYSDDDGANETVVSRHFSHRSAIGKLLTLLN